MTTRPSTHANDVIVPAADGRPLAATVWPGTSRDVVVVAPATGVKRGFYAAFAGAAAERGATVLTFDYRGIGGSAQGHPRHDAARMREWGTLDIEGVLRHVDELGADRLLWVGQSAGGSYLPLAASRERVDRLLTISTMSGYWGRMAPAERLKLGLAWHTAFPIVNRIAGHAPQAMWGGESLPPEVFREWGRWCRRRGYFFDDPSLDTSGYADLAVPVLAVRATDDPWATEWTHRDLHGRLTAADVTYRDVTPDELGATRVGHIDLLRQRVGGPLWPELLDWLLADA